MYNIHVSSSHLDHVNTVNLSACDAGNLKTESEVLRSSEELLSSSELPLSVARITDNNIEDNIEASVSAYIAKLYDNPSLTRKTIQNVIENTSELIQDIVNVMKSNFLKTQTGEAGLSSLSLGTRKSTN